MTLAHRDSDVTFYVATLALAAVLSMCGGCGGGALQTHASVATVTGVTLRGVRGVLHDARDAHLEQCTTEACLDEEEPRWAGALVAYESAREALSIYVEAIGLAHAAESDQDVLMALLRALAHVATRYNSLAAALRGVGVDAPPMPSAVAALLEVLQ